MVKVPGMINAVDASCSSEHLTPLKLDGQGLSVSELSVDMYWNVVIQSKDGNCVIVPHEHWTILEKLIKFARSRKPQ